MVVNPKTFYNRLLISSLIISLLCIGGYNIYSYNKLQDQKAFLIEEKNIIQKELSQIVSRFDVLSVENKEIKIQLTNAKRRMLSLLDSNNYQKVDVNSLKSYKNQIEALKLERDNLILLTANLNAENLQLKEENDTASVKSVEQTNAYKALSKKNELLENNLEKAAVLTANSFKATAFKTKSSGKFIETNKAKRTDAIEVCFTLAENALAEAGEKELYIQILSPNSTVIGDKLSESFGDDTLIYSSKTSVNYTNNVVDICVTVNASDAEQEFVKGTHYVTVFNSAEKLGSTEIVLN